MAAIVRADRPALSQLEYFAAGSPCQREVPPYAAGFSSPAVCLGASHRTWNGDAGGVFWPVWPSLSYVMNCGPLSSRCRRPRGTERHPVCPEERLALGDGAAGEGAAGEGLWLGHDVLAVVRIDGVRAGDEKGIVGSV